MGPCEQLRNRGRYLGKAFESTIVGLAGQVILTTAGRPSGSTNSTAS